MRTEQSDSYEHVRDNLTPRQMEILSVSGKIEKMEGIFIGWYYAALMSDNKGAAQVASDLKREASIAQEQFLQLVNEKRG